MGNTNSRQTIKTFFQIPTALLQQTAIWNGLQRLVEWIGSSVEYYSPIRPKTVTPVLEPRRTSTPVDPIESDSSDQTVESEASQNDTVPDEAPQQQSDTNRIDASAKEIADAIAAALPQALRVQTSSDEKPQTPGPQHENATHQGHGTHIREVNGTGSPTAPPASGPIIPKDGTDIISKPANEDRNQGEALHFTSLLEVNLPAPDTPADAANTASQPPGYNKHETDTVFDQAVPEQPMPIVDVPNKRAFDKSEKDRLANVLEWDSKAVYSGLQLDHSSIRIARIEPGILGDDIHVTLERCGLTEVAGQYEALSYVWGKQDPSTAPKIFVNKTKVPIGPNLFAALKALRDTSRERHVWIDAICINQTSFAERSREVVKMGKIYGQARKVIVFLGSTEPPFLTYIEELFEFLDRRTQDLIPHGDIEKALAYVRTLCDDGHLDVHNVCKGFVNMLLQPWWGRLWILQEFYLATDEPDWYWGKKHVSNKRLKKSFNMLMGISWHLLADNEAFTDVTTIIESETGRSLSAFKAQVQRSSTLISRRLQTHGFESPLRLYRELLAQAGVQHDYVYGLRSMFEPVFGNVFVPDYNMSKELLFACLVVFLIQFERWGDVLWWYPARFASGQGQNPSWLPDFSKRIVPHELDRTPLALENKIMKPELRILNHRFHAKGYVLDKMYAHRHIDEGDHHKIFAELWQFDHCMNNNHECHELFVNGAPEGDIWLKAFLDMYGSFYAQWTHFNSAFRGALLQSTMKPEDSDTLPSQVTECVPCWDLLQWHSKRINTPGLLQELRQDANNTKPGCLEHLFSVRMKSVFREGFADFFIGACIFDWDHISLWLDRFPTAMQWCNSNDAFWSEMGGSLPEEIARRSKAIAEAYKGYQSDIWLAVARVSWCYSFYYTFLAYVILLDCDDHASLARIISRLQFAAHELRGVYLSTNAKRIKQLAAAVPSVATRLNYLNTVIELFRGRYLLWTDGGFRGISCPGVKQCCDKKSIVALVDGISFPVIVRDYDDKTGEGWLAGCAVIRGVDMLGGEAEKATLPVDYVRGDLKKFEFR